MTYQATNNNSTSYTFQIASLEFLFIVTNQNLIFLSGIDRNWDIEPEDAEVYLSDTAMFQCAINSIPHANITWFKDNTLVTDRTNKFRTYPEGVLEIYNVEFSDLGTYHCVAEGVDRSRKSKDARLSQKKAGKSYYSCWSGFELFWYIVVVVG